MRAPFITTTFWPSVQRSPTTAPGITWQKCQTFVPGPTLAPSSTYADSWTNAVSWTAVTRRPVGRVQPEAELVEAPRDRRHSRLVGVVHRDEDRARRRQAVVGRPLRL